MALQMGINIPTSDIKNALEQNDRLQTGVRTWRQLFGNASLGASANMASATTDFSKTIADAYDANLARQNAIMGAGLNVGATKNLLADNRRNLTAAYDTYIRNYGETVGTIADTYNQEASAINAALTERATNFANVYNKVYDYLSQELYGSARGDKNYFAENNMDWLLIGDDTDGNNKVLRAWNDIADELFTRDGYITDKGVKFFDQVMNARPDGYTKTDDKGNVTSTRGFDAWLSDIDPELREWWVSADRFNYNRAGTNKGTGNVMLGRESTDEIYHNWEYLNGDEASKFTSDALNMASSSLEKVRAIEDNYIAERNKPVAQAGYEVKVDNRYKESRQESWSAYTTSIDTYMGEFATYLQKNFGTDLYADFYDEYASLYSEYDSLMKELKASSYYDESLVNKINNFIKKWQKAADTFAGNHKGPTKPSGL